MSQRVHPARISRAAQGLFVVAAVIVGLSACAGTASSRSASPSSGFGHVHGIGIDSADGKTYVATHTGVWWLASAYLDGETSASAPEQVGAVQDTMGFTVAGPRLLLASGHPAPEEQTDLTYPNLGLIQSTDGAVSWKTVSLRGQVDFHDLAAIPLPSGALLVYGYDATSGSIMSSDDGGSRWAHAATMDLRDLAVNTAAPDTVVATTPTGLQISRDRGVTFKPIPGAPALYLIEQIAGSPGSFVGVDTEGAVWTTDDGTASWAQHGRTQGPAQALAQAPHGTASWILVADDRGIVASRDYGATWSVLAAG